MNSSEFVRIEQMLQAAFSFLDFSDQMTHQVWSEALQKYDAAEVTFAVKDYIRSESKTPTVHDIVEYTDGIRDRKAREAAANRVLAAKECPAECRRCNDLGYVFFRYPTGIETVKPCDCKAGHERFGKMAFELAERSEDAWTATSKWGGSNQREAYLIRSRYKMVRVQVNDKKDLKVGSVVWQYEEA